MFGVFLSPFLLNATIDLQYLSTAPELVSKLRRSFYVDHLITELDNEEKAYHLCVNSKEVMKAGGFYLRKFNSNSVLLRTRIKTMIKYVRDSQEEPTKSSVNQSTQHVLEHRRYLVYCGMSLPTAFLSLPVSLLM